MSRMSELHILRQEVQNEMSVEVDFKVALERALETLSKQFQLRPEVENTVTSMRPEDARKLLRLVDGGV